MSKELKKEERNEVSGGVNGKLNANPEDIAHIDVLKDASATAIYGSRAANSNENAKPRGLVTSAVVLMAKIFDKKH